MEGPLLVLSKGTTYSLGKSQGSTCMVIIAQGKLKVWLDDERPMREDCNLHVKTARHAIDLLSQGEVEYISFDHDLGMGKTGYDVANWIEEAVFRNNFPRIGWDVHSANPVGAQRIKTVMKKLDQEWDKRKNI